MTLATRVVAVDGRRAEQIDPRFKDRRSRVILRIRARRHEFSAKTYRLHINVVVSLVMYCVILFVQLGLPVMLFVITLSWMTAM
ncbi:hypothetical protein COOONC_26861 [Cooperia oncophora]